MSLSMEGKVAVITGGASGIGVAIAEEFAKHGASVVLADRQQAQLDKAVAAIGPKSSAVACDVSKLANVEALYREVKARHVDSTPSWRMPASAIMHRSARSPRNSLTGRSMST